MSEVDNQLTFTAESSGILSKYKSPWPRMHQAGNLISYGYLVAGLGLPAGGTAVSVAIMVAWFSAVIKMDGNQYIGQALFWIVAGPSALLGALWLFMTPLALIVLLAQRRYEALLPPLFVALWVALYSATVSRWMYEFTILLNMLTFALGAFYGTKINFQQMKRIREEPRQCQPQVLGCGGVHELAPPSNPGTLP
jgi:hypothetical protein